MCVRLDFCFLPRGASRCSGVTYDLEGVGNDADSHELLSVVSAVHHEGVGEALNDGAVGLAEALDGIAASGVGDIDGVAEGDVVTVRFKSQLASQVLSHVVLCNFFLLLVSYSCVRA